MDMEQIDKEFALLKEYMDYYISKLVDKHYLCFEWIDVEYESQFNAYKTKDKKVYRFIGEHLVCKSISHNCYIFTFEEYKQKYKNGKYQVDYSKTTNNGQRI